MKSSYQSRTGHQRTRTGRKKSMSNDTVLRRKSAIERLKKQLSEGTKPNKEAIIPVGQMEGEPPTTATAIIKKFPTVPLTQKDIERIKKEIAVLETRI